MNHIDLSQKLCSCKRCRNLFNPVRGGYGYCPVCADARKRGLRIRMTFRKGADA